MAILNRRNLVLGSALAVTFALVAWVDSQEQQGSEIELAHPKRTVSRPAARVAAVAANQQPSVLDWQLLDGRKASGAKAEVDLFKTHSWYVPPPPKPAAPPAPPPKPVAPPAPFAYLGKMEDTPQGTLLILSVNNKVYTAAIGETLDKTWRLDGEDASNISFIYLPLNLPQRLSKSAKPVGAKPIDTNKTENQGTDL